MARRMHWGCQPQLTNSTEQPPGRFRHRMRSFMGAHWCASVNQVFLWKHFYRKVFLWNRFYRKRVFVESLRIAWKHLERPTVLPKCVSHTKSHKIQSEFSWCAILTLFLSFSPSTPPPRSSTMVLDDQKWESSYLAPASGKYPVSSHELGSACKI